MNTSGAILATLLVHGHCTHNRTTACTTSNPTSTTCATHHIQHHMHQISSSSPGYCCVMFFHATYCSVCCCVYCVAMCAANVSYLLPRGPGLLLCVHSQVCCYCAAAFMVLPMLRFVCMCACNIGTVLSVLTKIDHTSRNATIITCSSNT